MVVEDCLRVLQQELDEALAERPFALAKEGVAPDEVDRLLEVADEADPRLERGVLLRHVVPEVEELLLDAARVEGVEAGEADPPARAVPAAAAVSPVSVHQRVEDVAGLGRGHVELPPPLADVGDAGRAGESAADLHLARGAEREAPGR